MKQFARVTSLRDKSAARRRKMEVAFAATFETQLGWMALAERDEVLAGVVFGHASKSHAMESLRQNMNRSGGEPTDVDFLAIEELPESIIGVIDRLNAYAAGEEADFADVRVNERHLTDFGRLVVRACRRIPRGGTRSYGHLAAECGSPGAARAVGQVMARNRYPLVVPCHRVLAAGGLLGGFSSPQGLAMKRRLLILENEARYSN